MIEMTEFWQGVLWAVGAILALEIVSIIVQTLIFRHRRRHLPTHPVRTWFERNLWDRVDRWAKMPTQTERRAKRAPEALKRFEERAQHFRERLLASYPSLRIPVAPEPVQTLSAPRFGPPSLIIYHIGEYIEPLRCSVGLFCDGRALVDGEQYWAVPPDAEPGSPFLVICGDCTVIPEEARL